LNRNSKLVNLKSSQLRVVIGVSGGGTTMEAIIKEAQAGGLDLEVDFVFADRKCGAVEKAKSLGIKVVQKMDSENILEFHQKLTKKLIQEKVDVVVLAGYLRLFPITEADPYLVINSHPAAIPEFGGTGFWGPRVHETVLTFAQKTDFRHPYTYSTVHVASAEYDDGDILGLVKMEITPNDTSESIAERLLPLEHQNYIAVLDRISSGQAQAFENSEDLVLAEETQILEAVRQEILDKYAK
jgi:phosphoribosylglycinamide formyltransferase 1